MDRDDYDSPWKKGLVKYVPRFFEFFFPEIFRDLDWRRQPRFLDTKLQAVAPRKAANKRAGPRVVDALVELQQLSGQRTLVLVHIEIQAQKVKEFVAGLSISVNTIGAVNQPVCIAHGGHVARPGYPAILKETRCG